MEKLGNSLSYNIVERTFLLAMIGVVILIIACIFNYNDIRGVESNVVYTIQLALIDNSFLYQSPEAPPYNITQYSPLYYIVNDLIISTLQIDYTEFYQIRIISRILSTIALIIGLVYLKKILQNRLDIPKRISFFLCALFLIISFPWFNITRPDVFVLLFLILSIYATLSFIKLNQKPKYAILLGVFLFLGLASKITMAFYILPFGIFMLISKNWKLIFLSSSSFFITVGLFYVLLYFLNYDLNYLKENILDGINNGYSITNAIAKPYKNYVNYYSLFSIGFVLLVIEHIKKGRSEKSDPVFLFLIVLNAIIIPASFLAALKVGSAINYFNETLLCMVILLIYLLERHYKTYRNLYMILLMLFGVSIALNHTFHYFGSLSSQYLIKEKNITDEIAEINNYLEDHLDSYYFYSDNREIAMSIPDRCILFPSDIHNITYERKVFDYGLFKKWQFNKKLKYLIVTSERNQLYGINIREFYHVKIKYPNYYLYELTSYNNK